MKAVLIPGDGIGREIAESVREVSAALNTGIEWQEFAAGAEYAAESGELIAPGTLDAIEACGWALRGAPPPPPIGKGFRSINVQLRQRFSTYANLRPVHTLPGVPTRFDNVDLVIVRENTEDLYKGIEYMLNDEIANGVKLITRPACEKICRFAFDYARKNGRKKGHGSPQGQHHEADRRPVPAHLPRGRRGVPRDRRGRLHHRRFVHEAGAEARAVRRARRAEPLRRYYQ